MNTESKRGSSRTDTAMDTQGHPASNSAITGGTRHGPFIRASLAVSNVSDEVFRSSSEKASPIRALIAPAKLAGNLPPQYLRIRAARQIALRANILPGLGALRRDSTPQYSHFPEGLGHFDLVEDNRHLACQNVHNTAEKTNVCLSINPATLECLACPEKHLAILPEKPICVVLCDQNFSPLLPAKLGLDCISILRVEDGTLSDLYGLFMDVFRAHVRPSGHLSPGSTVIFGSTAHMALYGVQQHCEDMAKFISLLYGAIGTGNSVIPYIRTPLGGIQDDVLIRDMADFDTWLLNSGLPPSIALPCTRHLFWDIAAKSDTYTDTGPRTLYLPGSFRNARKQRTISNGFELPSYIAPFSTEDEACLITSLIEELSGHYALNLDSSPSFERGTEAPTAGLEPTRTVFLGASHTKRLTAPAEASGWSNDLLLPRWAPEKDSIAEICVRLRALRLTKADVLVLDLFSNNTYMGTDSLGMAVMPYRGEDGFYHVPGQLEIATQASLKQIWRASQPVIKEANEATLIFSLPLPRYVTGPCCGDPGHVENVAEDDYEYTLRDGQNAVRRVLEPELAKMHQSTAIFNPLDTFKSSASISSMTSSGGISIWADDPVHLSKAAYQDILTSLQAAIDELVAKVPGRGRIQSLIPVQQPRQTSRPEVVIPTPAWILGEIPARGAARGGRGGSGNRGSGPSYRASTRGGRGGRYRPY